MILFLSNAKCHGNRSYFIWFIPTFTFQIIYTSPRESMHELITWERIIIIIKKPYISDKREGSRKMLTSFPSRRVSWRIILKKWGELLLNIEPPLPFWWKEEEAILPITLKKKNHNWTSLTFIKSLIFWWFGKPPRFDYRFMKILKLPYQSMCLCVCLETLLIGFLNKSNL